MRNEVSVILILCGTLLVVTPPASDYLARREQIKAMIARTDLNNISTTPGAMSDQYRFGCWALGAAMIGIGVVGSWSRRCHPAEQDETLRRPPAH